ncbi:MAG: cell division protein DedD [Aeromonas sp.]
MATQFQHRLVGTVIFVALLVVFLPDLLDGQKNVPPEPTFAPMPLRPDLAPMLPVQAASVATELAAVHQTNVAQANTQQAAAAQTWEAKPLPPTQTLDAPAATVKASVASAPKEAANVAAMARAKPVAKPAEKTPAKSAVKTSVPVIKPMAPATVGAAQAGFILQLGAFRNAQSVAALVAKLRGAGYSAHSVPRTPVQGQLNRVFIGPDVSKEKLLRVQANVRQLTGLTGSVIAYHP